MFYPIVSTSWHHFTHTTQLKIILRFGFHESPHLVKIPITLGHLLTSLNDSWPLSYPNINLMCVKNQAILLRDCSSVDIYKKANFDGSTMRTKFVVGVNGAALQRVVITLVHKVHNWNTNCSNKIKNKNHCLCINPNHLKSDKILQGHFLGKIKQCWKLVLSPLQMGKITTWQEVQAISAEYERSMKMHGAG